MKKSELKKWAKSHMVGVENATIPSFTSDFKSLDEAGIRLDVQQAIKHGFFSTMCAAEVGLSLEEAKQFVSIVTSEAKGKIGVSVSLLMDTFEQNMELMLHAEKAGAQAVLLGYPFNWRPEQSDQIYEVTRQFSDAAKEIGIVLYPSPSYNFQRLHHSGFPLDALARAAELDNIIAMKCGELGMYAHCEKAFGDKLLMGCPVERFLPLLVEKHNMQWMGAGCYEVFQTPENRNTVECFNLLRAGKFDQAMELYWKVGPMRNMFEAAHMPTVLSGLYNFNIQKFYQYCTGGNGGLIRQPSIKVHQHELEQTKMGFFLIGIEPEGTDAEFYVGRSQYKDGAGAVKLGVR